MTAAAAHDCSNGSCLLVWYVLSPIQAIDLINDQYSAQSHGV